MKPLKFTFASLVIVLLAATWILPARVGAQGSGWSEPYQLSSNAAASSEGYLAADQYGYVHAFWTETFHQGGRTVIKYARFDGTTWTKPNDIYLTDAGIKNVSPVVDQNGILHIAWSQGIYGESYYSFAPAHDALSVKAWAKPIRIKVPARPIFLQVDSQGVVHVMYINAIDSESGVYYIRSEDDGVSWSKPVWLDPDIRPGYVPDSLSFVMDQDDGLHAAWFYGAHATRGIPDWVRYTHSLDGGQTWSAPVTLDKYVEGSDYSLGNASPTMIVQGQTVHVLWAAGTLPYRNHRFSTDRGLTWSPPAHVFGELHGQAFDGLAVDGAGRTHFFGQIRYPIGIYHAYWDQNRWSIPTLVYLIAAQGSEEGIGDRVHAHDTRPVVRAGNQLLLTFADGPADPNRRLFVTYYTMDDIAPLESVPTPALNMTDVPGLESALPMATPPPTAIAISNPSSVVQDSPEADFPIRVALIPTLLVLGAVLFVHLFQRRKV